MNWLKKLVIYKSEIVKCDECNNLLFKFDAQIKPLYQDGRESEIYFCKQHRVIWDKKETFHEYNFLQRRFTNKIIIRYSLSKSFVCDKNGKILKSK